MVVLLLDHMCAADCIYCMSYRADNLLYSPQISWITKANHIQPQTVAMNLTQLASAPPIGSNYLCRFIGASTNYSLFLIRNFCAMQC